MPRLTVLAAMLIAAGGCSYRLGAVAGQDADGDVTGSITSSKTAAKTKPEAPAEGDLVFAKAAASEALVQGKDVSVPWENPRTGARGTVTPLANSYTQDGFTCRDFLASYVRNGAEAWLQGEACRGFQGRWEIRSMRPWKRT